MITKEDVFNILKLVYKSNFDGDSMDILQTLTSMITCTCGTNKDEFSSQALDMISTAWTIYTLQSNDERKVYDLKVRGFLKISKELKKNGWSHFSHAEHVIKRHLDQQD